VTKRRQLLGNVFFEEFASGISRDENCGNVGRAARPDCGAIDATLHNELAAILGWIEAFRDEADTGQFLWWPAEIFPQAAPPMRRRHRPLWHPRRLLGFVLATRGKHDLLRLRRVERAGLQQPRHRAHVHDLVERFQPFKQRRNLLARQRPYRATFEFVPRVRMTDRIMRLEWPRCSTPAARPDS
jgi:hypothetical protein